MEAKKSILKQFAPPVNLQQNPKYDYLAAYNKIRLVNFSQPTTIGYLIGGEITRPKQRAAVSIIRHFIDAAIFYPHDIELSSDNLKFRVIAGRGYGGPCIKEARKFELKGFK